MIEKIAGITIRGRCFTTPTSLIFFPNANDRLSLVYGANGSGKSTISAAFSSIVNGQHPEIEASVIDSSTTSIPLSSPQNIFVFDEKYVDRNVKIDDDGLGCIVLLGEQIELQSEIDACEERYQGEITKRDTLKAVCEPYGSVSNLLCPQYHMNQIKTILKGTSQWARTDADIKGHITATSVTDAIAKEICTLTVEQSIEQLRSEFEVKKALIERTSTPNPTFSTAIHQIVIRSNIEESLSELLVVQLKEPALTEREKLILSMMQSGHQQRVEESKAYFSSPSKRFCPYCYQSVSEEYKNSLIESINCVLNKDVDLHKNQLAGFVLDFLPNNYDQYTELDIALTSSIKDAIKKYNDIIKAYKDTIQSKLTNVYTPITLNTLNLNDALTEINLLLVNLEAKRKDYIQAAGQRSRLKDSLLLINKQIAHLFCIESYNLHLKQIESKAKADGNYRQQETLVQQLRHHLDELKQRKQNLSLAIEHINDELAFVFFSKDRLLIELRDGKYYLKSNGNIVKPKNVSQGERNIIALCYFFIHIAANQELSQINKQEQFLVIDDPVSSFDFENKVGILSLLRRELKKVIFGNNNSKVLFLSHDLTTFFDARKALDEICSMSKEIARVSNTSYCGFELNRNKLIQFSKNRSEYAHLINDIFVYANGNDSDNISIGNKMRRVLEAFSTFCYRKGIEEVSYNRDVLAQLNDYADYFESRMYRLILHGESHFEEQIYNFHDSGNFYEFISEEEKRNTARDVLCFIYLLNQQHLKAYLPNAEQKIKEWCRAIIRVRETALQATEESQQSGARRKVVKLFDLPLSAGNGVNIFDGEVSSEDYSTDVLDCDFALRVQGDSMELDIMNGSIALIHKQQTIDDGEIGAFYLNGGVYCKKYIKGNGYVQLLSLNAQYEPITINSGDDLRCYGKVVSVRN